MKNAYNLHKQFLSFTRFIIIWVFAIGILVSPLFGQKIIINSGAYINIEGAVFIQVNNCDLVNNGVYKKGTETVTFSGNSARTISGTKNISMCNILVTNTGGVTTQLAQLTTENIKIEAGSKFAVAPAKAFTVSGTLANGAGTAGLVLQSNTAGTASLIHNTSDVPATVQRYISGSAEDWHFLSSPVSAQGITGSWVPTGSYANGTGYDLYLWNEPNNCWIYKLDSVSIINWKTVHPGANFVVGRGYLYSVQALNPTKEFVGNLNNGTINYGVTISSANETLKGFNLIGNPYPSSIDWTAATGWTRAILKKSGGGYNMWIWNPSANNYGVCNSATGIGTNDVSKYIAPMQGYFVLDSSAGNISTTNGVRVQNGASKWFKPTINEDKVLSVIVTSEAGNGYDEVQLNFSYPDNEDGALKLFSHVLTAPSLYMASDSKFFTQLYFTDITENPVVPLMFTPGVDGNYTIKCNFDWAKFDIVMLEDRKTNFIQNMKLEQTYNFKALKTDDVNRFALYFGPDENNSYQELPARIYADGSNLAIDLVLVSNETEVFIYDLLGRLILQKRLQGKELHYINISESEQIIIVYLKNPNGSLSRKLIWDK